MNKKIIILSVVVIAVIVFGYEIIFFFNTKNIEVGSFSLLEYQWELETFASDKSVGVIDNSKVAIEKAKEIWIDELSEIGGQPYNPINGSKIEVFYDNENDCWHVRGTLPFRVLGSVPNVIFEYDENGIVIDKKVEMI